MSECRFLQQVVSAPCWQYASRNFKENWIYLRSTTCYNLNTCHTFLQEYDILCDVKQKRRNRQLVHHLCRHKSVYLYSSQMVTFFYDSFVNDHKHTIHLWFFSYLMKTHKKGIFINRFCPQLVADFLFSELWMERVIIQ